MKARHNPYVVHEGARATTPDVGLLGRLRFWLTPGMGVKRYVLVAVLGVLLATLAMAAGALWLLGEERRALSAPIERVLAGGLWRSIGGWVSLLGLVAGAAVATEAIARLNRSLLSNWMPRPRDAAMLLHRRLSLSRGPRIVAFGGGTGLANLLRGLRRATSNLTGVVTVADDGGSSGRLRAAFGMPAPGDLSDCLAALSDHEVEVSRLMGYRFARGDELRGHTFGNLLITTLSEVEGDFGQATRVLNRLLNLSGAVWPATAEPVGLLARKEDGTLVRGESRLRDTPGRVMEVTLEPPDVRALPEVVQAVHGTDLVVLGPGSLYTSVLAPLLAKEIRAGLGHAHASVVYVCNIMTEAGETDGMTAFEHARAIFDHLGRWPDLVLVNDAPIDPARQAAYEGEGAHPVEIDMDAFVRQGVAVRAAPLLGPGPHAQHDPERLAAELIGLSWAARSGEALA